jgi:regulator of sirC expression with transglutaminase-like and TPR domain
VKKNILTAFISFFFLFPLWGNDKKVKTLYNSLDPYSIAQHLTFYELYPGSPQGLKALHRAWELLGGKGEAREILALSQSSFQAIIDLVNKQPNQKTPILDKNQLDVINLLAHNLFNRRLKGYWATAEEEIVSLPYEEIDLSHGLLLSQMGNQVDAFIKIRSYEGMLDLMALQILARLPLNASPQQKIRAINEFIFYEMRFRFPPHSLYAKDVDLYTFLPSVIDSRQGVCLGVSIMYLSLAQRLNLPLEVITPPGHIYIRYKKDNEVINIETTARGVHVDSDTYLGVDTKGLEKRSIKDVIGLAYINQAAVYSKEENNAKALECYQKALPYLPEDMLLKELMGYHYLFVGNLKEGKKLLSEVNGYIPEHAVTANTVAEDFLLGKVDSNGIKTLFMFVDEKRESILKKKDSLIKVLQNYPHFREGWLNLATAWLQLHRLKEALAALKEYWKLHPLDPSAAYYLSVLSAERLDYNNAWKYLQEAESILEKSNHKPKALVQYRRELAKLSPE